MKQVTVYTVDEEQAELEDSMLQLEYKEQYEAVNTFLQSRAAVSSKSFVIRFSQN